MDLQTFKTNLETELSNKFKFELLEFSFLPYSFGSGKLAYRINGICLLFIYDGKDNFLELSRSNKHEKYPNCTWQSVETYDNLNLFESSILTTLEK